MGSGKRDWEVTVKATLELTWLEPKWLRTGFPGALGALGRFWGVPRGPPGRSPRPRGPQNGPPSKIS